MIIPHKIIFYFKVEGHELLNDGRCSGHPVASTGNIILDIDANNKEEVEEKINRLTAEIKKLWLLL